MTAKTQDYCDAINNLKTSAREEGKEVITLTARELHTLVNVGKIPTLPTCCNAMRKSMFEGDFIAVDTNNKSNASMNLTIKYLVNDENRMPLFPYKKRGRRKGQKLVKTKPNMINYKDSKEKDNVVQSEYFYEGLLDEFVEWVESNDISFEVNPEENLMYLYGTYGLWMINTLALYSHQNDMNSILGNMIFKLDQYEKCSVLLFDNKYNRKAWEAISSTIKNRLNFTAIFIAQEGQIEEK